MTWSELPPAARAFRLAHLFWGVTALAGLGHVWASAILRRRGRMLTASVALLLLEGAALVVGRGDCPFGTLQARLGDPVPMFELALPPRAAKAAVPMLALLTLEGLVMLVLRRPSPGPGSRPSSREGPM